jgi:5'-nucleotidase
MSEENETAIERPIGLIDLDGTLADFDQAMTEKLAAIASPHDPPFAHEEQNPWFKERRRLIKNQAGFWSGLKPIPMGFEILHQIREAGFETHVLTHTPMSSLNAWTEKASWCQKHLPDIDITLTRDKGLVYGRLLFDDWPPYMTRWLARRPRGYGVMLTHRWNVGFEHPRVFRVNPEQYASMQRAQLKTFLESVYARTTPQLTSHYV